MSDEQKTAKEHADKIIELQIRADEMKRHEKRFSSLMLAIAAISVIGGGSLFIAKDPLIVKVIIIAYPIAAIVLLVLALICLGSLLKTVRKK